jgi:anti-anti-sigma factor
MSAPIIHTPVGRIDGNNAQALEQALMPLLGDDANGLILDLQQLDYISSAGLRILLMVAKSAKQRARPFMLAQPKPAINDILKVSGFDKIIPTHPTLAAAIASLA